jgi:hypothetical protein
MIISGFWGFATTVVISITILTIVFKKEILAKFSKKNES